MKKPFVIIGGGEIGGVFARGLLRLARTITLADEAGLAVPKLREIAANL